VLDRNNPAHPRTPHHTRLRAHPNQRKPASPDDPPILTLRHQKLIFSTRHSSGIFDDNGCCHR
jgi:hypothetical protein